MIRPVAASASQPSALDAADTILRGGGGAVDAIIAGFFCAAGASADVLLAPTVALVVGFGAGARSFDGRSAQPGRGLARPRGFVEGADIAPAARVAAPRCLSMLMLLHSYRARSTFADLVRPGVAAAEAAGAPLRAELLRTVGRSGSLALRAPDVQRALLAAGGPVAGGILSESDLEDASPAEAEAAARVIDGGTVHAPPFAGPTEQDARDAETIVACDSRGVLAALSYVPARSGVRVPELEIVVGCDAVPVRRGVTRIAPGTVLPAAAPLAIVTRGGSQGIALGIPGRPVVDSTHLTALAQELPFETALRDLRDRAGGRLVCGVMTDGNVAKGATV